ncbi:hypothetical protein F4561_006003 [Lipingzhangella halophila]|uniref:Uncharacterized protein n=1 Tax=Lipingzhangella halophila TaxID=1783352 RepID=A0A7W7RN99_9ACTN|nr:hypothetical protein [Lipingzhangella halophila]MBB4935109.1 hypothetical protein [Lipingzhangella halophila]
MLRIGRPGRVSRVASAVRAVGGSALRRLLLIGGFVVAAWFLGAAAASADEIGGEVGGADTSEVTRSAPQSDNAAGEAAERTRDHAAPAAGEAAGSAGKATENVRHQAAPGGDSRAGQAAERSAGRATQSANGAAEHANENAQSAPAADAAAEAPARSTGVDAASEVAAAVEQSTQTTERITESGIGDIADSAAGYTPESVGSAGGSDSSSGDRARDEQRGDFRSAGHSHSIELGGSYLGGTGEPKAASPGGEKPVRGGGPANTPLSSAPPAQSGTAVPVQAGFLPAAAVVPPETGLPETARHALAMAPQNPVDEPTVSPD